MHKALLFNVVGAPGALESAHVAEVSTPSPQGKQILARVSYASVNPVDWKMAEIQGGTPNSHLP